MKFLRLSLLSLLILESSSLLAATPNYPSIHQQSDYKGLVGFKNMASATRITAADEFKNSGEFKLVRDPAEGNKLSLYHHIEVSYTTGNIDSVTKKSCSSTCKPSNVQWFGRDVTPGMDDGLDLGNINVSQSTNSSTSNSPNCKWCADNWERKKIFVPSNVEDLSLVLSTLPSISKIRVHVTFGDPTQIDHLNFNKSFELEQQSEATLLSAMFQGKKTVEYLGSGNIEIFKMSKEEVAKYIPAKGGWLYIDAVNDNSINNSVLRGSCYKPTGIYFLYKFKVSDLSGYKSMMDSISYRADGDPDYPTSFSIKNEASCDSSRIGNSAVTTTSSTTTPVDVPEPVAEITKETETVSSEPLTAQFKLLKGWNMVSSPVNGTVSATGLKSSYPSILKVYGFNSSSNQYEEPTLIEVSKGYWLYSTTNVDASQSGIKSNSSAFVLDKSSFNIVSNRWNLLGIPEEATVSTIKSKLGLQAVYYFDTKTNAYSTTSVPAGGGFWGFPR